METLRSQRPGGGRTNPTTTPRHNGDRALSTHESTP